MQSGSIHPDTVLGSVALVISEIHRSVQFYQDILGLELRHRNSRSASLGAGGKEFLLLQEDRNATPPPRFSTGLFHLAILVPNRMQLAHALSRIMNAGWPVQGFADHGVSEAIYLADPDGNGIEVYRDYPHEQWPYINGSLQMVTNPLDIDSLLTELESSTGSDYLGIHPNTRLGHVHLRVANIPEAERFYCDLLGFDLVQRFGPAARFVSAGGYHHHIGFNSWSSAGAPPPPANTLGLRFFSINLPEDAELQRILNRLEVMNLPIRETSNGFAVADPSHNVVLLTT